MDTEYSLAKKNEVSWVPLTASLVEYPKGDLLGLFYALSSLAPMALHCGFIAVCVFRRDLLTLCFYFGFALNFPVNQLLKRILRQPRPVRERRQFGNYGMPSSHAQHLCYFATFGTLVLFFRVPEGSSVEHIGLTLILVIAAGLVSYGRIYLCYHTVTQVVVGGSVGCVIGVSWFAITHFMLTPWFPTVVSWSTMKFLLIRDTTHIPRLMWFEYNNTINYSEKN